MKLLLMIVQLFQFLAVVSNAHHCNEFPCSFMPNKRHTATDDLENGAFNSDRHQESHSFTGAEGIDHRASESGLSRPTSRRGAGSTRHKQIVQTSNNSIDRHDMHSFTGAEGIDHHSTNNGIRKDKAPLNTKLKKRLPLKNSKKVKDVNDVKHDAEGEIVPMMRYIFCNLYPFLILISNRSYIYL